MHKNGRVFLKPTSHHHLQSSSFTDTTGIGKRLELRRVYTFLYGYQKSRKRTNISGKGNLDGHQGRKETINLPTKQRTVFYTLYKAITIIYLTTVKLTKCRCCTIPKADKNARKWELSNTGEGKKLV